MKTTKKRKDYMKKWRENNQEKIKKYLQKNKEIIKIRNKKDYKKNKKKRKLQKDKWRENNQERIRKWSETYLNKPEVKARIKINRKVYSQKPEVKARLEANRQKLRDIENKRRKKLGLKLVGEGWISEEELTLIVKNLFKGYEVEKTRQALKGWCLELDIYIPKLKIAFEYNGIQHYKFNHFFFNNKEDFQALQYRDRCKKKLCKKNNIKLIVIKYNEELSEQLILTKLKRIGIKTIQANLK